MGIIEFFSALSLCGPNDAARHYGTAATAELIDQMEEAEQSTCELYGGPEHTEGEACDHCRPSTPWERENWSK